MSTESKIWLSAPHMGGREEFYVRQAFETNWVAPLGPNVDGFETDICNFTGAGYAAALSSGTAAVHLALIELGVGPGDHVLCQSFTFSASANPIVYQGAVPVFVDSEKETWNMDPVAMEEAIRDGVAKGHKPKAIIPVHLYGVPANMKAIMEIAGEYDIPVVEDAAEALGSRLDNKACGTFGQFGVLSFNGNKIITTSGGGALISDNGQWIKTARFRATQARDNAPHYEHSQIGYNYRLSNVLAGIGRGQMEVLGERVAKRRNNFERYKKRYEEVKGLVFQPELPGSFSNRWLTAITIDPEIAGFSREDMRLALEKENIESRPLWKPMHLQPVFSESPYFGGRVSEELFKNGLCLPSGSNLTEADFQRIFSVMDRIVNSHQIV